MDKQQLADVLADMALLLEWQQENPFKIRAYQSAARAVEQFEGTLDELAGATVKGIGKTIKQHIVEYAASGAIAYHAELQAAVPPVLFELVRIPGLGPKKALTLYQQLTVESLGELEYACRENRLVGLRGFGSKTQESVLRGIEFLKTAQGLFRLGDAWPLADRITGWLERQPVVAAALRVGELRRSCEVVSACEWVVLTPDPAGLAAALGELDEVQFLSQDDNGTLHARADNGLPLHFYCVGSGQYGYALHQHTGSTAYCAAVSDWMKEQGKQAAITASCERDWYAAVGLPYIAPELREAPEVLAAARAGALPELVSAADLRGALHVHTTYSDGSADLREMARTAGELGWEYLGISDHSQSAVYAGGLKPAAILEQLREIDAWNAGQPSCTLLAGIECDILADGTLDYPDEILAAFDFVIASVHSAFRQSAADMQARLQRAMENRYVTMLGHATGRILLARDAYAVDVPALIQTAATTGTMLEINASPYRLDLDWRWCRAAAEAGVLLSINPDAHAPEGLQDVRYGLAIARKGGLTAADVLNTRSLAEVRRRLGQKR